MARARDPQALLAHLDFVRTLAHDLLGGDADDLMQESWLAALRGPAPRPDRARHWLAVVVRNFARNQHRARARRHRHESRAARPDHVDPTTDVLAREETRRQVVAAVLALDEPFRRTVIGVYFDGCSCAAIARRERVPAATVRSRLRRALDQLRERLDDQHGGRAAWVGSLAPLARALPAPSLGWTVLWLGKAGPAAAIAIAALVVIAMLWQPTGVDIPPVPVSPDELTGRDVGLLAESDEVERHGTIRPAATRAVAAAGRRVYPADRALGAASGVVVDEAGEPVAGITVHLEPTMNRLPPGSRFEDDRAERFTTVASSDGTFSFDGVPAGPYLARTNPVEKTANAVIDARTTVAIAPGQPSDLVLRLAATGLPRPLVVEVVDRDGLPVAGAVVEYFGQIGPLDRRDEDRRTVVGMNGEPPLALVTGSDGRAGADVAFHAGVFLAHSSAGMRGRRSVHFLEYCQRYRIELAPTGRLTGRVLGPRPDDLVRVTAHAVHHPDAQWNAYGTSFTAEVQNGAYDFTSLAPGAYQLTVSSEQGAYLELPRRRRHYYRRGEESVPHTAAPLFVTVESDLLVEQDLRVQRGGTLEVHVLDQNGEPLANADVRTTWGHSVDSLAAESLDGTPEWGRGDDAAAPHPLTRRHAKTDAHGAVSLVGMRPGPHLVEVQADGLCYDRADRVVLDESGVAVRLEFRLEPDGAVQGMVPLGVYTIGLRRPGAERLHYYASMGSTHFACRGLRPGSYEVLDANLRRPWRVLGTVEVVAGRTTLVDLRDRGFECTGTVTDHNGPVSGVTISLGRTLTQSDSHGAFRFAFGYPPSADAHFALRKGHTCWTIQRGLGAGPLHFELPAHRLGIITRDANGHPVPARVRLRCDNASISHAYTNADLNSSALGLAEIDHVFADRYLLEAEFADGAIAVAKFTVPDQTNVELCARAAGDVEVRVVDEHGVPIAYAEIDAWSWPAATPPPPRSAYDLQLYRHTPADADGFALLHGVAAGQLDIEASAGHAGYPTWRGRADGELQASTTQRVTVVLHREE